MAVRPPAPAAAPGYDFVWGSSQPSRQTAPKNREDIVSTPLIAMVAVVGTAFLVVFYVRLLSRYLRRGRRRWRLWRRRRRLAMSIDLESNGGGGVGLGFDYYSSGASSNYFLSPYGLDDSAIKTLPLSFFSAKTAKQLFYRECAVCLVEFEENDSLRTLPLCAHSFHVDCIDVWLRSHANCPLCRAAVFRQDSSPFVPMRAARIRPSFDDLLLDPPPLPPHPPPPPPETEYYISEITTEPVASPSLAGGEEENMAGGAPRDFLLKRSYSFGFERNLLAERMMLDASTASPWRYRHQRGFWSKRWPSPFGGGSSSSRAARVFSFRSYRSAAGVKSPFFRRRSFFPLSESSIRLSGAGPSSRRTRSLTSPIAFFSRPSSAVAGSASSRLRCGDPEALLSPERLNPGNRG